MTGKKTAKEIKPSTVVANDPNDLKGALKNIGGSLSDHWNTTLAKQTLKALWLEHSDPATREKQCSATVAALIGIAVLVAAGSPPISAIQKPRPMLYGEAERLVKEGAQEGPRPDRREALCLRERLSRPHKRRSGRRRRSSGWCPRGRGCGRPRAAILRR